MATWRSQAAWQQARYPTTAKGLKVFEVFVHELHGHGPLPYGRSYPFDRSAAHVTGGEYPGTRSFQQQGRPGYFPSGQARYLAAREQEIFPVSLDGGRQPARAGHGANEGK
jgi:hypothetical protein